MKKVFLLTAALLCLSATFVFPQYESETPDARMLRFPDISAEKIVFVYAGDLWVVSKEGGLAQIELAQGSGTVSKVFPGRQNHRPDGEL